MTYSKLLDSILAMTEEQQKNDVTVFIKHTDEFIPAASIKFSGKENDVLDIGHPYITLDE